MSQEELSSDNLAEVFRSAWKLGGGGFERSAMSLFCPDASPEEIDELFTLLTKCVTPDQVVALRNDIDRFSARDVLVSVEAPTLVAFARSNGFHPLSEATKIAGGVRGSDLIVFDTANSMLLPSDPTAMPQVEAVKEFLSRN